MSFYFENENGDRLNLNNASSGLALFNVFGMGFAKNDSFADLENGFFLALSSTKDSQTSCGGTLHFADANPYQLYVNTMNWLSKAKTLYFIYKPKDTEYRKKVMFMGVDKAEMSSDGMMECDITLSPLTPWYKETNATIEFAGTTSEALSFDVSGSVFDVALFASSIYRGAAADVTPDGQLDASFKLEYYGSITNPVITIVGTNSGTLYGQCSVTASVSSTEGLILDTTQDNAGIWKVDASGTKTDLLNSVSLETEPFARIPITEPCTIKIDASGGVSGMTRCTAVIYYYYRTV